MSKTYRRKNYELENNTSWDRKGRKTAGFYTEYDYERDEDGRTIWGAYIFREPTKKELWKAKRWAHGENHPNSHSPGRWYRNNRMRENRMLTKEELHKFFMIPDYEPMVEANPRSCSWDWR